MGCFNTKGWFSHIQMACGEKAFALICIAQGNRTKDMDPFSEEVDNENYRPTGRLHPIALPIFGEYDSYGRIENIVHDENVKRIEDFFGSPIETIVDVLDNITTIFRCHYKSDETEEKLRLYELWRDKLGLNDENYVDGLTNLQIVMTFDNQFVYDAICKQTFDVVKRGLYKDRSKYSEDESIRKYWNDIYINLYGDDSKLETWELWDIPTIFAKKYYEHNAEKIHGGWQGGFYNGWGRWWHILDMYKSRVQLDEKGNHISQLSKSYDSYKVYKELEKLLYDETIEGEIIMFMSFMWFLHLGSIEIEYSYPTGQDDINDKIFNVYKEIGNYKV